VKLMVATEEAKREKNRELGIAVGLSLCAAIAFYLSTKATLHDLDYTSQIASALLHGHLGLREKPPDWLNEMIPWKGKYYSAFPLGAVLSMLPVALLRETGLIRSFPGRELAALIAGLSVYIFFGLAKAFGADYSNLKSKTLTRRIMLALFPIFGTWTWCNLGFGGAWQIALGIALLGQAAALYFTLVRPSPFVAGAFFSLAFGNRTELLITMPVYLYLFWRQPKPVGQALRLPSSSNRSDCPTISNSSTSESHQVTAAGSTWKNLRQAFYEKLPTLIRFLSLPVMLGLLTAAYNFARFHSIFDFGYIHIPEVPQEPWYQHGLFSIQAIPWNIYTMLFQGFESISYFPYILPNGFGCSIFLASPFLCLLFRQGGPYKLVAWIAISVLTLVLWLHGNPGSWQFSYRYAMILLPWMFLLLTGNGRTKISVPEISLFTLSVAINALATWQFLWTVQIQP
jgi:tetrahydromethanopterin S-methyltransferase subunit B